MEVCIQAKLDGVSLRATYIEGKLVELVTRGNGIQGDNITAHAPHITNLPMEISVPGTVHIRGEGVMYTKDFESQFKPQGFANARNTTSGLLKGHSSPSDLKAIHFVAYELYWNFTTVATESDRIALLQRMGFEIPALITVVKNADEAVAVYEAYDKKDGIRDSMSYKTDGLVLKINNIQLQSNFPMISGRPGHAAAVKPSSKSCVTRVLGISYEMGLSGAYTPVALVAPADLDGTNLKRVNLHNLDFLHAWVNGGEINVEKSKQYPEGKKKVRGGLGIGAEVLVVRAGDVIPYLADVIVPAPESV